MSLSKNIYSTVTIGIPFIIILLLTIAVLWLSYLYFYKELDPKLSGLIVNLAAGLILMIIQFFFSWYEYKSIAEIKKLSIKSILLHRDDRTFYQKLITNSKKRIDVLGVTAERFIEHFADSSENSREDARVLLSALTRGVKVRILVPSKKYLVDDDDKMKAVRAEKLFKQTAKTFQGFEYRYFNHPPAHSIVVIDDESLIGPVFPEVSSKHTPAIYLENSSPLAEKYLSYFEREWTEASPQLNL